MLHMDGGSGTMQRDHGAKATLPLPNLDHPLLIKTPSKSVHYSVFGKMDTFLRPFWSDSDCVSCPKNGRGAKRRLFCSVLHMFDTR
mmetsp:Transcript_76669/g.112305  ORF Transcript_76669/g.112305 Transcript_76669/m.112305 type:complete len:86 (+) Transcript_76669:132-389(+)